MSELFGRSQPRDGDISHHDAAQLEQSLGQLLAKAQGVSWYDEPGREADLAVARLCLLRRARAGVNASQEAGDDSVRLVLTGGGSRDSRVAALPRDLVHGRAGLPRPRAGSPARVVLHAHDDDHRRLGDRRALRGALVLVALFAVVEVVAGYAADSLALLADAGHMLGDAGSLGLALFAAWLGSRPASPGGASATGARRSSPRSRTASHSSRSRSGSSSKLCSGFATLSSRAVAWCSQSASSGSR